MAKIMKDITPNVILLGLVSLFTDIGSQMVFPLIPLFLTEVLGSTAIVVGLLEGSATATASLLKVFSGYWSDKKNSRKPFVITGYGISSLTKPLFALATIWPAVFFLRIAERIGKGIRTAPRDALVAESSKKEIRGKAFGIQRGFDGAGSLIGAAFAFFLLPIFGFRKIFLIAFIPSMIGVILLMFIKEKKKATLVNKDNLKVNFQNLPFQLKFFIVIASIFALGNFGYAFLLLKAVSLGFSVEMAILLYIVYFFVFTVFTVPFGILSDRFGKRIIIGLGYLTFALLSLGLVYVNSLFQLFWLFGIYGLFNAMIDGAQRAHVVDLTNDKLKGTALGTYYAAIGIMAIPSGLIAGTLWETISPAATFTFGFVIGTIVVVLFGLSRLRNRFKK